jgi:glycosyltransferase involved in cell wall biosynthesis
MAIESVINHPYPNLEYIVVDGASTDGSQALIEEYNEHIDQYVSEPDKGMYYALNKGMEMATGELIALVHSDDYLLPNNLLETIGKTHLSEKADLYYSDAYFVLEYENNCTFQEKVATVENIVGSHSGMIHPATVVRRKAIEKSGGYDTAFRHASDYELLLRLNLEGYKFQHVEGLFCAICSKSTGRVSNTCNGHLEVMRIHQKHQTGHQNKYRLSYLECRARKAFRKLVPAKTKMD